MTRRTFFSFHDVPDVWRAWNVRNCWVVKADEQVSVGFFDSSVFETSKKEGRYRSEKFPSRRITKHISDVHFGRNRNLDAPVGPI